MSQHFTPTVLIELSKEMNVGDRKAIRDDITNAVEDGTRTATAEQKASYKWLNKDASPAGVIF